MRDPAKGRITVHLFRENGWIHLIPVLALAVFLRVYRLNDLPPGLFGDEAFDGVQAARIFQGQDYPVYFEENWGEEPLYMYLIAISYHLFGITPLGIRATSAAVGIATVVVLYLLVRQLFANERNLGAPALLALLATYWFATSFWHVSYSRLGTEPVTLPLLALLTFYFVWRGLDRSRGSDYALAGFFLGASLYTYRASVFVPVLAALWLGHEVLTRPGFCHANWPNLALVWGVGSLVLMPLIFCISAHPELYFGHLGQVSILESADSPWAIGQRLMENVLGLAGMYTFRGDVNLRHNVPGRPVFDPLSSTFFALGLAMSIRRWKSPPHLFLLLWLVVGSLPSVLSDAPHFSRSIGASPAACVVAAIGVLEAWRWARQRQSIALRSLFLVAVGIVLATSPLLTYHDYFMIWAKKDGLRREFFHGKFADAATVMNSYDNPHAVWILPTNGQASRYSEPGHYTVEFFYSRQTPFHFLRLDEDTIASDLTAVCQGHSSALFLDWKDYDLATPWAFMDADPKRLLPFLLEKYGHLLAQDQYEDFDVLVYDLPESTRFAITESFEPVSSNFGSQIALTGVAYGGPPEQGSSGSTEEEGTILPSGSDAWVVLQWEALATPPRNYKVGVYLVDRQGRLAGQVDKVLLSNDLHLTSEWKMGRKEMDYYTLPSLPATPPGEYNMEVVVYDAETIERLTIFDKQEGTTKSGVTVGTLQIIKSLVPPRVEPMQRFVATEGDLAPAIRLLGYDLPVRAVSPGQAVSVALYWQALQDVQRDFLLSLGLKDSKGVVRIEHKARPVDDTYPTSEWDEGEILRDWHDLALPPDMPEGVYQLSVGVLEAEELLGEAVLGQIQVRGRPHQFTIPDIQYPMDARLGKGARFLGYDLSTHEVVAGGTLQLTLYWQALKEVRGSYTVFTHLLDAKNEIRGQRDSIPSQGEAPTTSWVEGEVIIDEYEITLDSEAPSGEYVIEIGMYDASTGQRLPVFSDGEDLEHERLLLGVVQIVPSTSTGTSD